MAEGLVAGKERRKVGAGSAGERSWGGVAGGGLQVAGREAGQRHREGTAATGRKKERQEVGRRCAKAAARGFGRRQALGRRGWRSRPRKERKSDSGREAVRVSSCGLFRQASVRPAPWREKTAPATEKGKKRREKARSAASGSAAPRVASPGGEGSVFAGDGGALGWGRSASRREKVEPATGERKN